MHEVAQVVFEFLFQLLLEVLADVVWRQLPEPARAAIKLLCAAAFAALLGFLSTLIFPERFITTRALALAYLVIAPLLLGWAMARIGRFLENRHKRRSSLERFGYAWLFAFIFTLTRHLLIWD